MKMIYYYWNIIINIKWTLMMDFKHERNSKREVFYVFPILNEFCIRYIKIFETTYQIQNQQHHVLASYSKHASERGQKKKKKKSMPFWNITCNPTFKWIKFTAHGLNSGNCMICNNLGYQFEEHPEAKLSMTCPIKHRPLSLIINLARMYNNQIKQWLKADSFDLFIW